MNKIAALLITLIAGLLFLIGTLIIKKVKNKDIVFKFSSALAFSVIFCLIILDIIPEITESFKSFGFNKQIIYFLSFTLIGIIILKILDNLVPVHSHHHEVNEKNNIEHNNHIYHIGLVTSIALMLHNIIEGMAIFTISLSNIKLGLMMCIGVGLHNIPLGMEISSSLDYSNKKLLNKVIIYILLSLSTVLGGFIIILFNNINNILLGILLSITCGMLIYILCFELLNEVKANIKSKSTILGLIVGILMMLITILI